MPVRKHFDGLTRAQRARKSTEQWTLLKIFALGAELTRRQAMRKLRKVLWHRAAATTHWLSYHGIVLGAPGMLRYVISGDGKANLVGSPKELARAICSALVDGYDYGLMDVPGGEPWGVSARGWRDTPPTTVKELYADLHVRIRRSTNTPRNLVAMRDTLIAHCDRMRLPYRDGALICETDIKFVRYRFKGIRESRKPMPVDWDARKVLPRWPQWVVGGYCL